MRTTVHSENKLTMLSEMTNDSKFQILQYDNLRGATDVETAFGIQTMEHAGMKLKQVRIILEDSSIKLESGALSYMKGDVGIKSSISETAIGIGKKLFNSKVSQEKASHPVYTGTGEIFLEPSFGYYALIELEDEEIIVDNGLFYACEEEVKVGSFVQKQESKSFFEKESGISETKISGSGIVVLELPLPETEIFKCKLYKDTLKVDGDLVILRTNNIEHTVEKSLNVYKGTGEVWLLPTANIYKDLKLKSFNNIVEQDKPNDKETE